MPRVTAHPTLPAIQERPDVAFPARRFSEQQIHHEDHQEHEGAKGESRALGAQNFFVFPP